jgi:hypothetical protein
MSRNIFCTPKTSSICQPTQINHTAAVATALAAGFASNAAAACDETSSLPMTQLEQQLSASHSCSSPAGSSVTAHISHDAEKLELQQEANTEGTAASALVTLHTSLLASVQEQQEQQQELLPASSSWIAAEQLLGMVGRTQQQSPEGDPYSYTEEPGAYWQHSNSPGGSTNAAEVAEFAESAEDAHVQLQLPQAAVALDELTGANEVGTAGIATAEQHADEQQQQLELQQLASQNSFDGDDELLIQQQQALQQQHHAEEHVQQPQGEQQRPLAQLQDVLMQLRELQHLGSPEHSQAQLNALQAQQNSPQQHQQQQQQQAVEDAVQMQLQQELLRTSQQLPAALVTASEAGPGAGHAAELASGAATAAVSMTAGLLDLLQQQSSSDNVGSRGDDEWLQLLARVENVDDPLQLLRALRGLHSSSRGSSGSSSSRPSGSGGGDDSSRALGVEAAVCAATAVASGTSESVLGAADALSEVQDLVAAAFGGYDADTQRGVGGSEATTTTTAAAAAGAAVGDASSQQQLIAPQACSIASRSTSISFEPPQQQQDGVGSMSATQPPDDLQLLQQLLSAEPSAVSSTSSVLASSAGLSKQLSDEMRAESADGLQLPSNSSQVPAAIAAPAAAAAATALVDSAADPSAVKCMPSSEVASPAGITAAEVAMCAANDNSCSSGSEVSVEAAASQLGSLIQQLAELGATSGSRSSSSSSSSEQNDQPTSPAAMAATAQAAAAAAVESELDEPVSAPAGGHTAPEEAADAAALFIHTHSQHWRLVMRELVAWVQHKKVQLQQQQQQHSLGQQGSGQVVTGQSVNQQVSKARSGGRAHCCI